MSSQTSHSCGTFSSNLCYICGEYVVKLQARPFSENIRKAYFLYFGSSIKDENKQWAPHICCVSCNMSLFQWIKEKIKKMPFAVPMV